MSVNDILDTLIASATADKNTLDALIAQLQHTTIASSDDTLYQAPTLDDSTGIWTLAQTTANVNGEYVGCYKLPVTGIDSYISSITVISHSNPASPAAPASVTPSIGSTVDLTVVLDLEGQSFSSFCIRSATPFEITLRVSAVFCETITMLATSVPFTYMSQNAENGVSYTVTISGLLGMGAGYVIDAFYGETGGAPGDPSYFLILDNGTLPPKPAFQSDHIYVLTIVGTGAPFGFRINDGDGVNPGYYSDNSGSFAIEICRQI